MTDTETAKKITPHQLGELGEQRALRYLKKRKYEILRTRFRLYRGEIDIIAREKETLVFFEVKSRRNTTFGPPEEAVTAEKQRKIRRIAQGFLALNHWEDSFCRFDVLALDYSDPRKVRIRHFKDAF